MPLKHFHIKLLSFLFLVFFAVTLSAQTDSLLLVHGQLPDNNEKVDYGNELVKKISYTDAASALKLDKAKALARIGWAYDFSNMVDSAVYYYQRS